MKPSLGRFYPSRKARAKLRQLTQIIRNGRVECPLCGAAWKLTAQNADGVTDAFERHIKAHYAIAIDKDR